VTAKRWQERHSRLVQACRDRGIWCQIAYTDEDRTWKREQVKDLPGDQRIQYRSWGKGDPSAALFADLIWKWVDGLVITGGRDNLIVEIANEGHAQFLSTRDADAISTDLKPLSKNISISWEMPKDPNFAAYQGAELLCLHWFPGWTASTLLDNAKRYRGETGNPVLVVTWQLLSDILKANGYPGDLLPAAFA